MVMFQYVFICFFPHKKHSRIPFWGHVSKTCEANFQAQAPKPWLATRRGPRVVSWWKKTHLTIDTTNSQSQLSIVILLIKQLTVLVPIFVVYLGPISQDSPLHPHFVWSVYTAKILSMAHDFFSMTSRLNPPVHWFSLLSLGINTNKHWLVVWNIFHFSIYWE
jgi:hypothetical protein